MDKNGIGIIFLLLPMRCWDRRGRIFLDLYPLREIIFASGFNRYLIF